MVQIGWQVGVSICQFKELTCDWTHHHQNFEKAWFEHIYVEMVCYSLVCYAVSFSFLLFLLHSWKEIIKKSLSMQAISAFSFSKSAHPSIKVCRLKLEKDIQPITLNWSFYLCFCCFVLVEYVCVCFFLVLHCVKMYSPSIISLPASMQTSFNKISASHLRRFNFHNSIIL